MTGTAARTRWYRIAAVVASIVAVTLAILLWPESDKDSGATAPGTSPALISVGVDGKPGNADSIRVSVDAAGKLVAFASKATNLVSSPVPNGKSHIYLRNVHDAGTTQVDIDQRGESADQGSWDPMISADGRYVLFFSDAGNLAPGANGRAHIYLRDLRDNSTVLVDANAAGEPSNSDAIQAQMSSDGKHAVFMSRATNLVPDKVGDTWNIFLRDLDTGHTTLVDVAMDGAVANGLSYGASIDDQRHIVAFASLASNLVPGDTNGVSDVFTRDLTTGVTTRISVGDNGTQGNDIAVGSSITRDGRAVAFTSHADNLQPRQQPGDHTAHSYIRDLAANHTLAIDLNSNGDPGNGQATWTSLTGDGGGVLFASLATNLLPGAPSGRYSTYHRDLKSGALNLISTNPAGAQNNGENWWAVPNRDAGVVAYLSFASDMLGADTGGFAQVYLRTGAGSPPVATTAPAHEAPNRPNRNEFLSSTGRGTINLSGSSYAVVPYLNYYATFFGSNAVAVAAADRPVPDSLELTESWRIDFFGEGFAVSGQPADAVVRAEGSALTVQWTTTGAGTRTLDHLWDRLDFQPTSAFGQIYRITHTVTAKAGYGTSVQTATTQARTFVW